MSMSGFHNQAIILSGTLLTQNVIADQILNDSLCFSL